MTKWNNNKGRPTSLLSATIALFHLQRPEMSRKHTPQIALLEKWDWFLIVVVCCDRKLASHLTPFNPTKNNPTSHSADENTMRNKAQQFHQCANSTA
jgi:hypothetical protein